MKYLLDTDIEIIFYNTKKIAKVLEGKTVLITGGNGFLGKYFVELFKKYNQFYKKKIELIVYDNNLKKNYLKRDNIIFIKKNVANKIVVKKKIDIIIHAAGIASPYYYRKKPLDTLDVAINGTRNFLEIAKKNNSKFIFFSSSEIYGDPDPKYVPTKETYRGNVSTLGPRACYDESKRLGETLCYIYNKYKGIHTNVIRPFNVYGPGMNQNDYRIFPNFISNILNKKQIKIYGSGEQKRTYCYITDAIEGFVRVICLGKSGQAYNIGNNKPEVSVKEVFKVFKKIHEGKINAVFVDHPKSYPKDEPQRRCPDLIKSKKHLMYKPKIELTIGLKKYLNWAKLNYKY